MNISALDKSGIIKGKMKIRNDKELISEEEYNEIMNKNKKLLIKVYQKKKKIIKKRLEIITNFTLKKRIILIKLNF